MAISLNGTERTPTLEQQKRAEEALRSNEQSLRLIVDTIPGHVCVMTAAGEIQLLNRQVLEYFGKTTEELKNWAVSDAVHPYDLPSLTDAWRRSVETGQPFEHEHRERSADGVYRRFRSRALPARDTEGRITGWYMLLTDIEDRRRAEDELRQDDASFAALSMPYRRPLSYKALTAFRSMRTRPRSTIPTSLSKM
jgi:PAS domain S-box-containing protein